ncbi:MAG: membrane associated rhomboid family serine protease [Flavobacteriaceae bacterium]|jgi:membrane associated rhomboid family serine protease
MKISFNAPFTVSFSLIAVAVYFLFQANGNIPRIFMLEGDFQLLNWKWYISLVGYTMGHGSVSHLIGNISIILLLGPFVERRYGIKRLLFMLSITGILTALVHITFWDHRLIGASGIVFMFFLLSSLIDMRGNVVPFTFVLILILFVGQEIVQSFQDDRISQFAHISGGVMGAIFGIVYRSKV